MELVDRRAEGKLKAKHPPRTTEATSLSRTEITPLSRNLSALPFFYVAYLLSNCIFFHFANEIQILTIGHPNCKGLAACDLWEMRLRTFVSLFLQLSSTAQIFINFTTLSAKMVTSRVLLPRLSSSPL